ncbi:AmmeMemoRadiSam system protein B [Candidatus Uhrbacteria bacterium]|nr:AmmeMemoRadiSam system protein B [Candidatus Uhrbacteria bacterium]
MIVFAATVPHSPLLISTIGKEHRETLAKTIQAYAEVEQALYIAKPETLVILSPHAQMYPDAFSGNVSDIFVGQLKEFGDHGTTVEARVDFLLLDHLHRAMREENVPFTLTSQPELDYGFTIPLLLLTSHLKNWKLIPLATSLLDARMHYEFGRQLKRVLHAEERRVAVIASADLSHHANANAPEGATAEGQQFDATVREKLKALDAPGLLAMDQSLVEKAGQCGYKPILSLLGSLEHINCQAKELCYEAPFGVGYLTERFDIT